MSFEQICVGTHHSLALVPMTQDDAVTHIDLSSVNLLRRDTLGELMGFGQKRGVHGSKRIRVWTVLLGRGRPEGVE